MWKCVGILFSILKWVGYIEAAVLFLETEHILSENLFTLSHVLTFLMLIPCVFPGENWKEILRGLGKATIHIPATESCFLFLIPQRPWNFSLCACWGGACITEHYSGLGTAPLKHLAQNTERHQKIGSQ